LTREGAAAGFDDPAADEAKPAGRAIDAGGPGVPSLR
jgi:hypothetical protein